MTPLGSVFQKRGPSVSTVPTRPINNSDQKTLPWSESHRPLTKDSPINQLNNNPIRQFSLFGIRNPKPALHFYLKNFLTTIQVPSKWSKSPSMVISSAPSARVVEAIHKSFFPIFLEDMDSICPLGAGFFP